ncbi:hypothetical protein HMPREF9123_2245 [Neisseria bacilliformis ATCC BAA-1200]|uniref:Uncharacterized protein n=1 Tax=Neisseria bacilliformis ATCC BAA-1200 TaxID=888742 RepID=F2BET8_9NEIS|nr:hypothetical protein HMPREF9123_2245 [Neisseria bacilliformis ATCC BAA-1200]
MLPPAPFFNLSDGLCRRSAQNNNNYPNIAWQRPSEKNSRLQENI